MYRLGWDERNGGNISYMLEEEEVAEYLDIDKAIRQIPLGFHAAALKGKIFIVTGTGKYFKNVDGDPENNLGIIRIAEDGCTANLLWGYKDGGKFTSELPAHLMSHMARLAQDPDNRIIMHTHPTYTLAMTFVHELDDKKFTHSLWQMITECVVVFPDGVGVLPWMLCGNTITDPQMVEVANHFGLKISRDFLNLYSPILKPLKTPPDPGRCLFYTKEKKDSAFRTNARKTPPNTAMSLT